jgi:hypothetical protein|tara:strand:+ start:156 stop:569 length:414 start_codon:yes stop_codon:yes gene_type:complete
MLFRFLLVIFILTSSLEVFADQHPNQQVAHEIIEKREVYKTEDILLLFKSCYETIQFLGTTKYKRKKLKLTEIDISQQCFCICDKVREKYAPKQFLVKSPLEIHNIIAPLANDCLKKHGQSWYDDVEPDKEKKDDSR